jgi:hypothetical protein
MLQAPLHRDFGTCFSPWIFPNKLGLSFFCATLLAYWHASRTSHIRSWLVAGGVLGCTFLAHTAPALILGVCGSVAICLPTAPHPPIRWRMQALAALFGTAAVVSLPYVWTIIVTYHLHLVNDAAMAWAWPDLDREHIREVLMRAVALSTIPFLGGFLLILARVCRDAAARLLVAWLASAMLMFAYGWVQQALHLVSIVPQYHFFLYITGASMVCIGVGMAAAIEFVAAAAGKLFPWRHSPAAITVILASASVALFTALSYPRFLQRADFNEYRREAQSINRDLDRSGVVWRIQQHTSPADVILATAEDSLWRVAPSGRYVVGVRPEFSNPFVPFDPREAAQNQMLAAFLARDRRTLNELARTYAVTHVLLNPEATRDLESSGPLTSGARCCRRRPATVCISWKVLPRRSEAGDTLKACPPPSRRGPLWSAIRSARHERSRFENRSFAGVRPRSVGSAVLVGTARGRRRQDDPG